MYKLNQTQIDNIKNMNDFIKETSNLLEHIKNIEIPNIPINTNNETVFIEFCNMKHIEYLIRNMILTLPNWSHTVICGNNNIENIKKYNIHPNLKIINLGKNNLDRKEYNKLLLTEDFWNNFIGEKLLIYQSNTIIFHNNINQFLEYDYVGALWTRKYNNLTKVGNGGFSLRSKKIMLECLNKVNKINYSYNEDIWYTQQMVKLKIGKLADEQTAQIFSQEHVKSDNPLGGHQFWLANIGLPRVRLVNTKTEREIENKNIIDDNIYFIGLITRCKDEFFIKEFCEYYLYQGVDKIYVIDDNSNDKSIYNNINDNRVIIIYEKDIIKNCYADKLYKEIKSKFKWMIYCDIDEFITTKKNITNTIKDELNTTFKDVDCIKIPWVIMSCNMKEENPKNILLENTYRWDHNKKHPHKIKKFRCRYNEIEIKCIFKTNKFNSILDHYPENMSNNIIIVDSINKKKQELYEFYKNLRENDIENGFLLCYHYRIISKENCINKLKNNFWYIQNNYTIDDLMLSDYPEIIDETNKYKSYCYSIKNKLNDIKSKYFLGLITRCKNEFFIEEFCNYYLNQGVEHIFILDDKSTNIDIYNNIKNDNRIFIYYAKHNSKCHDNFCSKTCTCNRVLANEIYKNIKDKFKWIIYVDVDEFITTRKNIQKKIIDELQTTYKNVDCISIPWIMMSAVNKKNPESILETNIYRFNYDNKPNYKCDSKLGKGKFSDQSSGYIIQCKSIFKCDKFDGIHDIKNPNDHHPVFPNCKNINWIESVNNLKVQLNFKNYNKNLTEKNINLATLLCYHYRIISEEHAITKLTTNDWYIENGYTLDHLMKTNSDIIDETLKYKSINNKLKFVHITKTSGTYIEDLGLEKNIYWGRNDTQLKYLQSKYNRKGYGYGSWWHEPIIYLNEFPYNNNTKIFTIVRNPYDRIISECLCKWGSVFIKEIKTKEDLNFYINQQVKKKLDLSFHHFLPQYIYTHNEKGEQKIDIIIKYEEIDKFNDLMKNYLININYIKKEKKKIFNIEDISKENIKLINEVYNLDFIYYNYKKY